MSIMTGCCTSITLSGAEADNYILSSDTAVIDAVNITAKTLSTSDFTVDVNDETYTGSEITKNITSNLVIGTDYTVTYENNTDVGTATITITGIGNFTGELTYKFSIFEFLDLCKK